jgi:ankyrin repeat protein
MGHPSLVRSLIQHGASPAVADDIGETPLHLAATVGQQGSARELLALGADVNQRSKDG